MYGLSIDLIERRADRLMEVLENPQSHYFWDPEDVK